MIYFYVIFQAFEKTGPNGFYEFPHFKELCVCKKKNCSRIADAANGNKLFDKLT